MSVLSASEQTQINISLGGIVVSNYLSYLAMGIVLSATWTYFSKFPNDTWWLKVLVILCVSMCISDTIGTGMWTYDWAVANYANLSALSFIHWAIPAEAFLFGTCGLIVQLFYAWRIWMMSLRKNWILPIVIGCFSILGWCILCWAVHILGTHKHMSDFTLIIPVIYIWFGGSVAADVLITGSMIYYLDLCFRIKLHKTQQIDASYHAPRRFRQLMVRTVECNLLSLFAQTIAIGLFSSHSVGFYFVITDMTLAKVYTFSLLVSLNCRHSSNSHGTSGGESSSSKEGGGVELTALHTSSIPSTQLSADIQRETTGDWPQRTKGPAFNADELDADVVSSPV
ncbi:hypothetical protein BT96DRAFT_563728 [Gymnopus androsaceus JB14]|uniref:DUF6534 domain-containing protein n=1 Tax=Gymnopus androsaceus JB14 TaxID=1447944 RepID=A0A6A4HYF0_9AGAR|nr:hypothetical protein BT96DRAFT_563728 [Gymnopus androsaceus JB14]